MSGGYYPLPPEQSGSGSVTLNVNHNNGGGGGSSTQVPVFNILPYSGPRCDICGFTDVDKNTVIQHIRTVHCAERDSHIHKQDQLIQDMKTQMKKPHHPLSNKKLKPFTCHACEKGFAQKIHLDTHLKNVHVKDRPYKCQLCTYNCANKGINFFDCLDCQF